MQGDRIVNGCYTRRGKVLRGLFRTIYVRIPVYGAVRQRQSRRAARPRNKNAGGVAGSNSFGGTLRNCGWLSGSADGAINYEASSSTSSDVVSFDSANKIVVSCMPDRAAIAVAKGASKTVTLKTMPSGKTLPSANLSGGITATVSPDATIAAATMNGSMATVTGKKAGTGAVELAFTLKPTYFNGSCDTTSGEIAMAPSVGLTVKDATGFSVDPVSLALGIKETKTIKASASSKWAVEDETIAAVSDIAGESIEVTGLTAGTTRITATNELGETAVCTVTVTATPTPVGGSSGGCSSGFGTLALLALMPMAWRRKK